MKAIYKTATRNKAGNVRHLYTVTGTPAELEQFKAAQGKFHTEDTDSGAPLYWTGFYKGPSCEMVITKEGKAQLREHTDMLIAESELKNRGALGQMIASTLVAKHYGASAASPAVTAVKPAVKPAEPAVTSGIADL